MCLKVIENDKHKDVHIREGEVSPNMPLLYAHFFSYSILLYMKAVQMTLLLFLSLV